MTSIQVERILNKLKLELKKQHHNFYLVEASPWPFVISWALFFFVLITVGNFHDWFPSIDWKGSLIFNSLFWNKFLPLFLVLAGIKYWAEDVIGIGLFEGKQSSNVNANYKIGFFLFIVSEAVFFLGIFWAFIHLAIVPSYVIGVCWPPRGLETIDKFLVPVCNTLVLLCSGISITWSHRAFLENKREDSLKGLEITVILGIVFLLLQFLEYKGQDSFVISSTSYYSAFYFATGFHGFHVFIGTVFLIISLHRFLNNEYTQEKHIWYEVSIWYWHFVDIIWLFVYLVIYYWGGEPRSYVWY